MKKAYVYWIKCTLVVQDDRGYCHCTTAAVAVQETKGCQVLFDIPPNALEGATKLSREKQMEIQAMQIARKF